MHKQTDHHHCHSFLRRSLVTAFTLAVAIAIPTGRVRATTIVDWEEFSLAPGSARPATASDELPIVSQGVTLNRSWNHEYDCCPSGWAISRQIDQTTAGVTNAFSAVAQATSGGGYQSTNFVIGNSLQQGEATIDFAAPSSVQGLYVTNSTYSYQAVVNGDDGAGFVSGSFKSGDWFQLEVIGLDDNGAETGRVPIYLADYRQTPPIVIDDWTWLDLSRLGDHVSRIEFAMGSTDSGPFGMNTPAYFAIDNLTYSVPEPTAWFALPWLVMLALQARQVNRRMIVD